MQGILDRIAVREWDVLLIGDGSGVGWGDAIGSFCTLIDRESLQRKTFGLAASTGTINLAEGMPYLWALMWYTSEHGPGPQRVASRAAMGTPVYVHIVTDSQATVTCGNQRTSRKANKPMWAAFDSVAAMGYSLRFHHVGRDTVVLNVLADIAAETARKSISRLEVNSLNELCKRYAGMPPDISIYDLNAAMPTPDR